MEKFVEALNQSFLLHWLFAFIDVGLSFLVGMVGIRLFLSKKPKGKTFVHIFCLVSCALCAAVQTYAEVIDKSYALNDLSIDINLIQLYLCSTILFFSWGEWRKRVPAFCWDLIKAYAVIFFTDLFRGMSKYLLLMFFGYNYLDGYSSGELLSDTVTTTLVLGLVFLIGTLYRKRNTLIMHLSGIDIKLFILITVTASVFILSMLLLGVNNSAERRTEFLLTLSNIPLFAVTIGYAVRSFLRAKISEENYKKTFEMQMNHFETLDKKNDELRIFRHDMPKKLKPLLMYIHEGNTEQAEQIIRQFNIDIEASRPRFNTGNHSLDTVLECEQQTAEKHGVTVELVPGSVFPAVGIDACDIYTILSNAIDNAIEATEKVEENKTVSVESRIKAGTVYLRISNPYSGKLRTEKGELRTTKEKITSHGYGFRSIKKTAAKYGSNNVSYKAQDGIFRLSVELKMPENDE